jgi:transposase InsO family protein
VVLDDPQGRHAKRPGPAVNDDLVQRNLTTEAPDLVWVTDITERPTTERKLYCCAIKDVFSTGSSATRSPTA